MHMCGCIGNPRPRPVPANAAVCPSTSCVQDPLDTYSSCVVADPCKAYVPKSASADGNVHECLPQPLHLGEETCAGHRHAACLMPQVALSFIDAN